MYAKRSSKIPKWKILITLYSTLLMSGLFFAGTSLAQITPADPPDINHCIEEAADSSLNCTANDVNLGLLVVDDPEAECTETAPGSGIFTANVKFQANLVAGANERWDIGMFIGLDGGDARTGVCGRNYLPPNPDPLANPGTPGSEGLGGGVGPHYDGEEDEDPGDTCGDLPQGIHWFYDLLEIDGITGLPVEPELVETYTIQCIDTNDDGFVDVGTCTSWDNNRNNTCTNLFEAYPNTKAKCNCERTETTLVMPAFLTLVKHVVNDHGGTAAASDWTLHAGAESFTGSEAGVTKVMQPGTYDLSESPDPFPGYTNTSITCDNATGEVTSVTVASGDEVTCTFVNDDIAPTLTLVKTVINDDGGTLTQADFPSFVDGNPQAWDVTVEHSAGAHTVSETPQFGYAASSWSGDCAADGSITLTSGDEAVCYITNDDIAPTLELNKTVVNDDGGTLTQADFPSFVDGSPQAWDAVVAHPAGNHTASETEQFGYAAGDWGGDCATDGSVTMTIGNAYVCTITNDDIAPTLQLIKTVVNGSNPGGELSQADFPSFVDGSPQAWDAVVAHPAGSHTASETQQPGYIASDWSGDCAADGSVSMTVGNAYVCYITNTAMGMVDLLKLSNGIETTDSYNFSLFGPGVDTSDSTPPALLDFGSVKLIPGDTYTICELNIPSGIVSEWSVDGTPLPFVGEATGELWEVYNPDAPADDNGNRCVDFVVGIGETVGFTVDNRMPLGDARTPGYWSNWSSCSNGNQFNKAAGEYAVLMAATDGLVPRHITLDEILPQWIGDLYLDGDSTGSPYDGSNDADCDEAVLVLQSRDQNGKHKKHASDAAYKLARSLLAYLANQSPVQPAYACPVAAQAAIDGQALLDLVNYIGVGDYLSPKGKVSAEKQAQIDGALELHGILDAYNNNDVTLVCF